MSLMVDAVSWKFPVRLQVNGVRLSYPHASPENETPLLRLRQAALHFRVLPLVKRRFHVQSLSIDRPQIYWNPEKLMSFQATADMLPATEKSDSAVMQPLPVSFSLSRFTLSDFDVELAFPDSLQLKSISLTGLHVEVGELHVPSDFMNMPEDIRARVRLFLKDSEAHIREATQVYKAFPRMDMAFVYGEHAFWSLDGDIRVDPELANPNATIGLKIGADGCGFGQAVRIRNTALRIGRHELLRIDGDVSGLSPQMTFHSRIQGEMFPLSAIRDVAEAFVPQLLSEPLRQIDLNGGIRLAEGSIQGNLKRIDFSIKSMLAEGRAHIRNARLDRVAYGLDLTGSVRPTGLDFLSVKLGVRVGETTLHIDDSSRIAMGPIQLNVEGATDSTLIPTHASLTGAVDKFLDGTAGLTLALIPPQKRNPTLFDMGFDGRVVMDSMLLQALPNLPPGIKGLFRSDLRFHGASLYAPRLSLTAELREGAFLADGHQDTLPPYRLESNFQIQADSGLQVFRMNRGFLKLTSATGQTPRDTLYAVTPFLASRLNGRLDLKQNDFLVDVDNLRIITRYVMPTLPASVRRRMEGTHLDGAITANLQARGALNVPDSAILQGRIHWSHGAFHQTVQGLTADSIQVRIAFSGNNNRMDAEGHAGIGSVHIPMLRTAPVSDVSMAFRGTLYAQDSLRIVCDSLSIRDLGIRGTADFIMDIDDKPEIRAGADIRFESDIWVKAVQQLDLSGMARARVSLWSTDQGEKMYFKGQMDARDLRLQQGKHLTVRGINAHVPFEGGFDVARAEIIQDPDYKPPLWIEYESRRPLYRKTSHGFLSVDTVDVAGYPLSDIRMDLIIEKGYVQIPWFALKALEGNVGGACRVRLGNGSPEQIAYEIHAQASRINSAALGNHPIKKKADAELNASLEFRGKGVDIEKEMDLDGFFHITQIGPRFASELLRGLDPTGSDRNIRLTRRLIDMGYKPQLFSFDLRHGYVYPMLKLSQPWFTPVRIPGDLKYGRLPLKFFLDNPELGAKKRE